MELYNKYRKIAIISFILFLIISFIFFAIAWNQQADGGEIKNKFWLIIFTILMLALVILIFYSSLVTSDSGKISAIIHEKVEIEKSEILAQMTENDEVEKESEEESDIAEFIDLVLKEIKSTKTNSEFGEKLLKKIANRYGFVQGLFYGKKSRSQNYTCLARFAYTGEEEPKNFKLGEALTGQVAKSREPIIVEEIPENYFKIESGLGKVAPKYLIISPILLNKQVIGIIELASFKTVDKNTIDTISELCKKAGNYLSKLL
ncbi:MAG: GAF domain-containing protein [Bacteroidales bacterium]|nr:GAF domain-containing protein [Bacteroidales bacterium]